MMHHRVFKAVISWKSYVKQEKVVKKTNSLKDTVRQPELIYIYFTYIFCSSSNYM